MLNCHEMFNYEDLKIKLSQNENYKELLLECYNYAKESNHPTTHVGASILDENFKPVLFGKNVLPKGVLFKSERFEGDNRHLFPNHAERDVIYKAAKNGVATNNLIMVMPWLPCIHCANAIISSGIKKLIVHRQMIDRTREGWIEEYLNSVEILTEAGVEIIAYDGTIGVQSYMHSDYWEA